MSRRVRWLKQLTILVAAIGAAGLVLTLLVHALPAPRRGGRERVASTEQPRERREFRSPQFGRGLPAFLKQIAIVAVIAVVGRKVLRIRL